jgi:hypothetical protein
MAYTKIIPEANIELTGVWNMYFYTDNPATHYQSGIQSDLEALAIKRFKNGFGIGFVESWIQQVTDDEGTLADRLNGFVGLSGVPSALARLLPTLRSWVRVTSISTCAGSMTSTSAKPSKATDSILLPA